MCYTTYICCMSIYVYISSTRQGLNKRMSRRKTSSLQVSLKLPRRASHLPASQLVSSFCQDWTVITSYNTPADPPTTTTTTISTIRTINPIINTISTTISCSVGERERQRTRMSHNLRGSLKIQEL